MDIPLDARDAAQTAARREGLSLGEWLTRRILKRYSELTAEEREQAFHELEQRVGELSSRVDRLKSEFRSEPLREAVRQLHQGLGRLSSDLVQTTGESTIRVSALSRTVEDLVGRLEQAGAQASQTKSTLDQRFEAVRRDLETVAAAGTEKTDVLSKRLESLARTVHDAFGSTAQKSAALELQIARVGEDVQACDGRIAAAHERTDELIRQNAQHAGQVSDRLEQLGTRLDRVSAATSQSSSALQGRVQDLDEKLVRLDGVHKEHCRATAERLDQLAGKITESGADTAGMCGALDHRLLLVQQNLQSLDRRHAETADGLARGRGWVAEKLAELRNEAGAAQASLNERFAAMQQRVGDFDRRHEQAVQIQQSAVSKAESVEASLGALTATVARIEADGRIGALESQLQQLSEQTIDAVATLAQRREHVAALEEHLQQIAGRTALAETKLAERQDSIEAIGSMLQRLDNVDRRQDDVLQAVSQTRQNQNAAAAAVQDLEQHVAALGSQIGSFDSDSRYAALAQKIDELASRSEGMGTDLGLVQEHTKAVGELLQGLDTRLDGDARRQQDSLDDLKSELLDELSRTLAVQLEAEQRKQEQALEELHASFAASALKRLEDRLDEQSGRQERTYAEFHPATPAANVQMDEEPAAAPVAAATFVSDHDQQFETAPTPPFHDSILELTTPAPDFPDAAPAREPENGHFDPDFAVPPHAEEAETGHFNQALAVPPHAEEAESGHQDSAPPPFADASLAGAVAPLAAAASEPLDSAGAFARDAASEPSPVPASFLSAARQSLKVAAEKNETPSTNKPLLGLNKLWPSGPSPKGRSDSTSYALLAGIGLVAILAIAITAGELLRRQTPQLTAAAPLVVARHVSQPVLHQVARPAAKATRTTDIKSAVAAPAGTPRLEQLANAGDSQAQMLLGLQEIGTDKADAAKWLRLAAVQGLPVAQYRLATLYAQGHGVGADPAKAFRWYSAAAKGGNRKAMSNLAVDYAQGTGTSKDPQEAARWFSKAAQLGLVDAQFDLAVLYERGLGVPQSLIDAYRWYLIAAKAGDQESKDRVDALTSQLSADDRAAAEAAAARFKPEPMDTSANEPQ